jgi:hypothetical protein
MSPRYTDPPTPGEWDHKGGLQCPLTPADPSWPAPRCFSLAPEVQPVVQMLPTDSKERKAAPICSGVLDYFPLALAAIARMSRIGNDKHNPGAPLHWSRDKSSNHRDCIVNHLIDCGVVDPDTGELHDVALAWRALANLEIAEESRLGKPPSRGSR